MIVSYVKSTVAVSGGTGFCTIPCSNGELAILSVVPDGSYEFDVRLRNNQDVDIEAQQDLYASFLMNEKRLPLRGNATCYLENATDGNYEVYATLVEKI